MKKYFVSSDIHSFFTEWRNSLHRKGFDINNREHIIIVCGDLFDRGFESDTCFSFVEQLAAQNRFIYIKGNHEDLLYDCVKEISRRREPGSHHFSNGTIRTIASFLGVSEYDILSFCFDWDKFDNETSRVLEFIETNSKDYYELGDYIFVHGWIPTAPDSEGYECIYDNWREGNWREARWQNGMECHLADLILDNKTIVCGHWHTSYGWHLSDNSIPEWGPGAKFDPFIMTGIIAIDTCTAYTKQVNVIVFNETENGNIELEDLSNGR